MYLLFSSSFSSTDLPCTFWPCLDVIFHGRHMTVSLLVLVQAGTCKLSKDRWSKISRSLLRLKILYEAPWRTGISFVMKKYKRLPLCRKKWIKHASCKSLPNSRQSFSLISTISTISLIWTIFFNFNPGRRVNHVLLQDAPGLRIGQPLVNAIETLCACILVEAHDIIFSQTRAQFNAMTRQLSLDCVTTLAGPVFAELQHLNLRAWRVFRGPWSQEFKKNYTPLDPKQSIHIHCSVCVHVCRYMSILAPDAGNCSSMSIQNDMNHKHSQTTFSHATRLRLFLPRRHLHLRQSEGDKVGDKWDRDKRDQKG